MDIDSLADHRLCALEQLISEVYGGDRAALERDLRERLVAKPVIHRLTATINADLEILKKTQCDRLAQVGSRCTLNKGNGTHMPCVS